MNRLQQMTPPEVASNTARRTHASPSSTPDRENHPHAFFAPLHYEKNYQYPLVIWLHGPDDDERQLQRVMPLISMRNYVSVGPRGTVVAPNGAAFDWVAESDAVSETELAIAEQVAFGALDAARERFHIDEQKVFVAGLQSGGTMALRIGLMHPNLFAGALSIGGEFPTGHTPLQQLQQVRQLPLFIAHCRDSETYTTQKTCEELRLFHAAGMNVMLRQYPCPDELTTKMLQDMDAWMMEHVTGIVSGEGENRLPFSETN